MDLRDQRFGIEVELTGLSRQRAAQVLSEHFGTRLSHDGGVYDAYSVLDSQSRTWKIVSDASIHEECKQGRADSNYRVEMVSPICKYGDIATIQEIVRKLRAAGAVANSSCGIHVHVDASPHNANTLRNITNIMASKEDLIYKALQVSVSREHSYCKKVDERFLEELNRKKPKNLADVSRIWYNGEDRSYHHYDDSRYHCLNLHSVFSKGTIEFRLFNSTTHAGKIKAYIQLSLAISHQALSQRCASRTRTQSTNEKYTFRTWLLRLGLIGDEFKTARLHLLENLDGCIAWKDPAQAEQQKELLRQKKEKEQEQAAAPAPAEQNQEDTEQTEDEESPGFFMSM
ncbi:amidoligase family protein [Faecalispora anaeroviscerum]|uniref:amidoligase family protein n=1 Tax=Faecalispora anaeroviscerum TaxID=2991836 RepID=UPI0024BAC8C0|nr:amidoligase family protein [Faecalispora anaeroviscerum]